jgi:hypothetical protein
VQGHLRSHVALPASATWLHDRAMTFRILLAALLLLLASLSTAAAAEHPQVGFTADQAAARAAGIIRDDVGRKANWTGGAFTFRTVGSFSTAWRITLPLVASGEPVAIDQVAFAHGRTEVNPATTYLVADAGAVRPAETRLRRRSRRGSSPLTQRAWAALS